MNDPKNDLECCDPKKMLDFILKQNGLVVNFWPSVRKCVKNTFDQMVHSPLEIVTFGKKV